MKTQDSVDSICQAIEDRLLEGEKLTGHPELVEHVGSCLECFRTMSELRELPRIAEVMRGGAVAEAQAKDPGPAFWNALPERVAAEVLGSRGKPQVKVRRWWAPAALASAGLAGAVATLLIVYGPKVPAPSGFTQAKTATKTTITTTTTTASASASAPAAAVTSPAALASSAESDGDLTLGDLADLSATELRALSRRLTQDETAATRALTGSANDSSAEDDGEGTALEKLAGLSGSELQRLTQSLGLELE
ncbi:MAG: hypothetical protein QOI66_304 [Myxococcales bacterium]|nr:hypothetical protein [Myxococcales bacterium]